MHRLTIALLAAFDAFIAVVVGLAVILAPVTLLWALSLGATHWDGVWPTTATIWQFGHHVPITIQITDQLASTLGLGVEPITFVLSLAPLAFAAFTAWCGARSGVRAARAGSWISGVAAGVVLFAVAAAAIALTSHNSFAAPDLVPAIAFPTLIYSVPVVIGAVVGAWIEGDGGLIDGLHDRVDQMRVDWAEVPALVVRGVGIVLVGFIAVSALAVAVAVIFRGGDVIALYQASGVDPMGATMIALASLAYLPTLMMWALSWIAGPGFVVGAGASVSPAATHLGVVPGLPPLGLIPQTDSIYALGVVLLPIGIGVLAGWAVRSRYHAVIGDGERFAPRLVLTVAIAGISAGVAAVAFAMASGSIGPGRMEQLGPQVGLATAALFVEVLLGAAITLLSPRGEDGEFDDDPWEQVGVEHHDAADEAAENEATTDTEAETTDLAELTDLEKRIRQDD